MAQSRKDSRGYALRTGECQRSDGRYSYQQEKIIWIPLLKECGSLFKRILLVMDGSWR